MARQFRLGWAPDGWDELARALRVDSQDLVDSGLGFVNRRGRQNECHISLTPLANATDGHGGAIVMMQPGDAAS